MTRAIAAYPSGTAIAARGKSRTPEQRVSPTIDTYWTRSESPLTNLAFLLPLLAVYDWGTRYYNQGPIIAFAMFQQFCGLLNVHRSGIPALTVIVVLGGMSVAKRPRLQFAFGDLPKMTVEAILLAVPLLVLWFAIGPYLVRLTTFSNPPASALIPCIGAGIYEEFLFRLVLLNLLSFILVDVLQLHRATSAVLMVLVSAVLFSAYHYLGSEHFLWVTFIFRLVAGLYFAAIFLCRGYALTCGAHASYDMIVVLLQVLR